MKEKSVIVFLIFLCFEKIYGMKSIEDKVNNHNKDGYTLLSVASENNHAEIVQLLSNPLKINLLKLKHNLLSLKTSLTNLQKNYLIYKHL